MYMSYCKFEGTHDELQACFADVEEHIYEEAEYEVSENEIREFRKMINTMVDFMTYHNIIDGEGELDQERLDEICEKMRHSYIQEEG